MTTSTSSWAGALKIVAEDARRRQSDHPSAEELLAYHARELVDARRREELQDHLASCHECARAVLDMATFPEVEPREPQRALSDREADTEISDLQRRLAPRPRRSLQALAWPVAAALALAVVGLSLQVRSLRQALSTPGVVTLESLNLVERGQASSETQIAFPAGVDGVALILNYVDPEGRSYPEYVIELVDEHGAVRWTRNDVMPTELGSITCTVPRSVRSGSYRVVVYGVDPGGREPIAESSVRFVTS